MNSFFFRLLIWDCLAHPTVATKHYALDIVTTMQNMSIPTLKFFTTIPTFNEYIKKYYLLVVHSALCTMCLL